ncbi:unnamed protein product [Mucor hiemalis]
MRRTQLPAWVRTYQWNPQKCIVVASPDDDQRYRLCNTEILNEPYFSYLGFPIKLGGIIDCEKLVQNNINKASTIMSQLAVMEVNAEGFPPVLASKFYRQIVRTQFDYGLAISPLSAAFIRKLEVFQKKTPLAWIHCPLASARLNTYIRG